ncbi:MAG TPA: hypothetical protein VMY35_06465 [Phycisphaerae bacterium]|nr:hypothetical protein [Phycisphaerae bacterium]
MCARPWPSAPGRTPVPAESYSALCVPAWISYNKANWNQNWYPISPIYQTWPALASRPGSGYSNVSYDQVNTAYWSYDTS